MPLKCQSGHIHRRHIPKHPSYTAHGQPALQVSFWGQQDPLLCNWKDNYLKFVIPALESPALLCRTGSGKPGSWQKLGMALNSLPFPGSVTISSAVSLKSSSSDCPGEVSWLFVPLLGGNQKELLDSPSLFQASPETHQGQPRPTDLCLVSPVPPGQLILPYSSPLFTCQTGSTSGFCCTQAAGQTFASSPWFTSSVWPVEWIPRSILHSAHAKWEQKSCWIQGSVSSLLPMDLESLYMMKAAY